MQAPRDGVMRNPETSSKAVDSHNPERASPDPHGERKRDEEQDPVQRNVSSPSPPMTMTKKTHAPISPESP